MAEREAELKSFLMKVKEESEKAGLKLSIQKTKIMASSCIISWQIYGKKWKQWQTLFFSVPKSLQMVIQFSSVQSLSRVWLFATSWTAAHQASLSITNSRSPHKPISIELVMPSNHLIVCRPLLLLPSIFPSIRLFHNESALRIRWPKYWSFSFNISPSNEHPVLDLVVQGTLKSVLLTTQFKASILWCSAFFIVQISHPYMTTGKTIALTRWNFVGKVMSLLFNMLSKLVIAFLPRSKYLLISWLQSHDFGAQKYKVCHCFHCFPIYLPWSDGTRCHDLSFLNIEF